MGETKKESKKEKSPKKLYLTTRYEALKADTEKGKKLLDPKNATQSALIYRSIEAAKEPPMFSEILEAIKPQLKGKKAETIERNARWYVNDLKKKGLLKSSWAREESA